jgi:hypothetical protein
MAHRGYMAMALLFAVAAVAVGACGGNDDDSATKASSARGVTGEQDTTTPRTGASGATGTKRARPKRTRKSKERSDGKTAAGERDSGATPAGPSAQKEQPKPHTLTPAELKLVGRQQARQARIICKASTLEGLAQQYGIESADPDKVARAFATAYLPGVRQQVAAGCKAGLLESK